MDNAPSYRMDIHVSSIFLLVQKNITHDATARDSSKSPPTSRSLFILNEAANYIETRYCNAPSRRRHCSFFPRSPRDWRANVRQQWIISSRRYPPSPSLKLHREAHLYRNAFESRRRPINRLETTDTPRKIALQRQLRQIREQKGAAPDDPPWRERGTKILINWRPIPGKTRLHR